MQPILRITDNRFLGINRLGHVNRKDFDKTANVLFSLSLYCSHMLHDKALACLYKDSLLLVINKTKVFKQK